MKGGRRRITLSDIEAELEEAAELAAGFKLYQEKEYLTGLFIRLPVNQKEWLEETASEEGISLAALVRKALTTYRRQPSQEEQST